jgi:hypothetical protein
MEVFIEGNPPFYANSDVLRADLVRAGVPQNLIKESIEGFNAGIQHVVKRVSECDPWVIVVYN